jgi:hypothetical protein
MLERINDLPDGLLGLRARGQVTRDDYERVVLPELEAARRDGRHLRLLYHFGPEFTGFAPGGAWEDFRVGLRYLRLFDRCAVVTNTAWVRTAARAAAALLSCPTRVFDDAAYAQAVEWLTAPLAPTLSYRLLPDRGVIIVELHGRLRAEDFDALEAAADEWVESAPGSIRGIVVHAPQFPGWENLGSLLRHLRFVRDQHRRIRRVALAVDGAAARLAPAVVEHFVLAEIKQFSAHDLEPAIVWAAAPPPPPPGERTT